MDLMKIDFHFVVVVNSLLGGSATLLWMFINTFQLISFIPLSLFPAEDYNPTTY